MLDAFEEIYRRYAGPVRQFLLRLGAEEALAEDLTADTFLKAMNCIDSYDGSVQMLTWLCTVAKRLYFNHRKKKGNRTLPLPVDEALASKEPSPQQRVESKEAAAALYRALTQLPSPQKDVVYLRAFADLSFAEIASIFEKTESWARVSYFRAKKQLKEMLTDET